jgi:tetratricopeptide (TPR) repeat protein
MYLTVTLLIGGVRMEKKKRALKTIRKPNIIPLPMDATFFFERAVRSLDRFHYEKAVKYFRKAVEYEPENPVNHCNLAGVLSEMGQYRESNRILQHILTDVDPKMTECHFYMANNFANMADSDSAETAIVDYLEQDPDGQFLEESEEMIDMLETELKRSAPIKSIKSREDIFEHDKARSLLEEGRFTEAMRLLQRIVKKNPEFMAARNNLALAFYYMGQFDQAMDTIVQVLELEPGNLHGLCNLAIFYQHLDEQKELHEVLTVLRKMHPYHQEHVFKLATTMGILGEHKTAYQHFRRLLKKGGEAANEPSIHHYTAVAAYNIGRLEEAKRYWIQATKLDPKSDIPRFYLNQVKQVVVENKERLTIGYHYHLPFEEQFRLVEHANEGIPDHLRRDPLVRSSFFWALRHGDTETKLQVIQAFGVIADGEVEEALRGFVLEADEDDYLKKLALFVLRTTMEVKEPIEAHLDGRVLTVSQMPYSPSLPSWKPEWKQVGEIATASMFKRYDLMQLHDLETLWVEFLTRVYPQAPRIAKPAGWAAALEYMTAKMHRRTISYDEVARRYNVSPGTVTRHVKLMDEVCRIRQKMDVIFEECASES